MLTRVHIKELRQIIRDVIIEQVVAPYGRNWHTIDDNPIGWEEYPGINIDQWGDVDGGYYAQVIYDYDDSLSTPLRKFQAQEDAQNFVRQHVDVIKRIVMGRDDVPSNVINLVTIDSKNFDDFI